MNLGTNPATALAPTLQGLASPTGKAASALDDAVKSKDTKRTDAAAEDFEAVFISEMLKPMFEMVEVNDTFGGGKGEEVFRDMMVQEYGKMVARQGGIGLASQIKADLIRIQEHNANPHVNP